MTLDLDHTSLRQGERIQPMRDVKFSAILGNFGTCSDRFVNKGYSEQKSLDELFRLAGDTPSLKGVELVGTQHIREDNIKEVKENFEKYNLQLASIIPDHFSKAEWGKGSFSSKNSKIRRRAIDVTKTMMDIAAELGCNKVSLWLGQDGFDYSFQGDYIEEREWITEGIRDCAKYRSDIKVCIEYKIKEPRTHSYINTVGTTLLIANEIGLENVGVTLDVGHALNCYENVADSVAILKIYGDKLFHLHLNDNYRLWDDDMIVGSVHTIEYLELLFWLDKINYRGWYSMDLYPYREIGAKAVVESIKWIEKFFEVIDKIGRENIAAIIKSGDATRTSAMLRRGLIG